MNEEKLQDGLVWDIDFTKWLYQTVRLVTIDGTPYEGKLTNIRWREISCKNKKGEVSKLRLPEHFELNNESGDPISFEACAEIGRV